MTEEKQEKPYDLKERSKQFALRIIRLYSALPKETAAQVIGKQLLRSGTSVGANYREANRSRSSAEFISKLQIALQELDESMYWLELVIESGIVKPKLIEDLMAEALELYAIFITCVNNAKKKSKSKHTK